MAKEENYKSTEKFEQCIKEYFDSVASDSPEFAKKYNDPEKSITECCNYIVSEVKRIGRKGYTDGEIYQMARHYYNEPNDQLEIDHSQEMCKVVTNEENQEKFEQPKPKSVSKPKPKKKEEPKIQQISIFDLEVDI